MSKIYTWKSSQKNVKLVKRVVRGENDHSVCMHMYKSAKMKSSICITNKKVKNMTPI